MSHSFCEDCAEGERDGVKCGRKGEGLKKDEEEVEEEETVFESYNIMGKEPETQPVAANQHAAGQNITQTQTIMN